MLNCISQVLNSCFSFRGAANPGRRRLSGGETRWKAGQQAELPAPRRHRLLPRVYTNAVTRINRRDCGKGLLGFAALAYGPRQSNAQESPAPQGAGKGFRHLSWSDIGGRPDSVQVMLNRRHLYVGHMFSNGVTILDTADPPQLKPVGFFTGGDPTPTQHPQGSDHLPLLAKWADIVCTQASTP